MRNQAHSDAANGFNLPSAFKSHNDQTNQMIAIAVLVASICAATIVGAQIIFG